MAPRTPLRHMLLILLAGVGLVVAVGQFTFIIQSYSRESRAQVGALLRHAGGTLAANLEAAMQKGDDRFVDHLIAQQITLPDLLYAALVDADGRVIASSLPGLRGFGLERSVHGAPPQAMVDEVRRTRSAQLAEDVARQRLWGIFPVRLPAGKGELRAPQVAYVVLLSDVARLEHAAVRNAFSQSMVVLVPILLLSLAIWAMLRVLLTDRIERLLAYSRSQASGGELPEPVSGADELGQLGEELGCLMREVLASRDFHVRLLESMPNPIWRAGADGRRSFFNRAWLDFTGRSLDQECEDGWTEGVHDDDLARCQAVQAAALERRAPFVMEYRLRFNDGSEHWISDHGQPVFANDGGFLGYLGSCYDLQQVKSATAAVAASEERFRALVEHTLVGVFLIRDGRVVYANPRLAEWLGYRADSIVGVPVAALLHPQDLPLAEELIRRREQGDTRYTSNMLRAKRRDGSHFFIEVYGTRMQHDEGAVIIGTVLDVNAREEALSALKAATEVVEASPTILLRWKLEPGWPVFYVSENVDRWGYSRAQVLAPDFAFASLVHPDDLPRVSDELAHHIAADVREYVQEYRIRTADGVYIWIEGLIRVSLDSEGRPHYCEGLVTDISARKEAELEVRQLNSELEARVVQRTTELELANKELETFTYSVSHDLKAPLRGIDGYSHLLLEDHADRLDDEGRAFVNNIRAGVKQMARLIDDLLAYSRMERRSLQRAEVNLGAVVRGILGERAGEPDMTLAEVDVDVPDIAVQADPEGLAQVLRNLVSNALKYSRHADPPRIGICARKEGTVCHLYVRDNGIGFDMKFHDRIFEIFQRLQRAEDYAGTGVGLAIVRKAMQRMGGRVWAESAPGNGATFHVELPL
ncbi:PAS domain S-box protein [Azoarcus sp. L1K30]|uniref:PAS domain S-box protein n=1 Tax=Azoarcus sp. L1K30 TaxID=2820277 RepID=UPI001B8271D0|nr:PAS domain S-box protein [Azoarcus sp. L1K30]MBR0568100.1 PAS domain S-box protein [Azoarcus sp. L1K30]